MVFLDHERIISLNMPTKKVLLDELMGMKKRMDRLYAESFTKPPEESGSQPQSERWRPLADVVETDDAWVVLLDLPGVMEEDLEVRVDESQLIIQGIRNRSTALSEKKGIYFEERPVGRFFRELIPPDSFVGGEVTAELNKGVLTVTMRKGAVQPRKIKVQPE